ncbi:hypothetical protein [Bradyrhizobium lablabi]
MRIQGTDQYTVWNTDTNGNWVSNGTGGVIVSGSNSAIKSLELSFNQDLNGDGIISTSSTPLSSASLGQGAATTPIADWIAGQDSFVFRTDHLAAHADATSTGPLASLLGAGIVHDQIQLAASGMAGLHSDLGAVPAAPSESHLAELLLDHHFMIR